MKVLVDAGVGRLSEDWLAGAGHDVVCVPNLDPRMTDRDILNLAVTESRLVLTMDKDFGELVYRDGRGHAGVVLLRLKDATGAERRDAVAEIFTKHLSHLPDRFSVFKKAQLRTRT